MTVERAGQPTKTQRAQIEAAIQEAIDHKEDVIRVRVPVTLYSYGNENRTYIHLRDAAWNIQLPTHQTTPEAIEDFIDILGRCVIAIASEGSLRVRQRLDLTWEPDTLEPNEPVVPDDEVR